MKQHGYNCLVILICVIVVSHVVHTQDVYASISHLKILASGEKKMLKALDTYIEQEEQRLNTIAMLLDEIETAHKRASDEDSLKFVGNPLNAFHLIKRFATKWRMLWNTASNFSHYDDAKQEAERLLPFVPQHTDYQGALQSILRVQTIYQLATTDLAGGWVAGRRAAPLSQITCYDLGDAALKDNLPDVAISWFEAALANPLGPPVPHASAIPVGLADAFGMKEDYERTMEILNTCQEADPLNMIVAQRIQLYITRKAAFQKQGKLRPPPPMPEWRNKYMQLCRRSVYMPQRNVSSSVLKCYLKRGDFPYQYVKVELVHSSPDVFLFHDIVTQRENDKIKELARNLLTRAKVGTTLDSVVSRERVGKVAWLFDPRDELLESVTRRVAEATGLNVNFPSGEPLQVGNYGVGGHYEPHYDHDEHRANKTTEAPEVAAHGDRMATVMLYLSEVDAGGATVFPKADLFVQPVNNAAVMWYNHKRSGDPDILTLHAACPVLLGEKWVANKWIREFGQTFKRPCSLNRDD